MGGPSAEHNVSLESGRAMLAALHNKGYRDSFPVVISPERSYMRDGDHVAGVEAFSGVDAVLLGLHGEWGEDGQVQSFLEYFNVPYNGSRPFSSALAMDKVRSRRIFQESKLRVPAASVYHRSSAFHGLEPVARLAVHAHTLPIVVKPAARGSSVGVSLVRHPSEMFEAMQEAFRFDERLLVEAYQRGTEVSCGVLEDMRGRARALPVVQIVPPPSKSLFDYESKYSGITQEIVPAPLTKTVTRRVQDAALVAHKALGCRHYSRVDMMLVAGKPVVLEVNTLPGMTPESIFPKAAAAANVSFPELVSRLVELSLRKG